MKTDIRKMSKLDLKIELLHGNSFWVDNLEIRQITLREIIEMKHSNYRKMLDLVTVEKESLLGEDVDVREYIDITVYEMILRSGNAQLIADFIDGLKFFLGEDRCIFHDKFGLVFGDIVDDISDFKILNKDNFNFVVDAIKFCNGISDANKDNIWNPRDAKAKAIIARIEKAKRKIQEVKSKDSNDDIDFADIVSAVSVNSKHFNKTNIWDLKVYQLFDEFKGIDKFVEYNTNIQAIMNGSTKINLRHWASNSSARD